MSGDSKYNEFFSLVVQTYSDVIGVDNTWRKHQECICIIQDMCEKIYKVHHKTQDVIKEEGEEEKDGIDPTLDKFYYYFDGGEFYIKSCHNCGNSGDDCSQYLCCVDWELEEEEEEGEPCDPVFVPEEEEDIVQTMINNPDCCYSDDLGVVGKGCDTCNISDACIYSTPSNPAAQIERGRLCKYWSPKRKSVVEDESVLLEDIQALESGEAVVKNGEVVYKTCYNCMVGTYIEDERRCNDDPGDGDYCDKWEYDPSVIED